MSVTCRWVGVMEDVRYRVKWRQIICCGDPQRQQLKEKPINIAIKSTVMHVFKERLTGQACYFRRR